MLRWPVYLITSLFWLGPVHAEFVVPTTPHPVNDYANVLSADVKDTVAAQVIALKTQLNVQMGILIVPTLDGTDIESASMKVAESWKLGTKDDAGILLMLSMAEHKSRLEIGKGLEGVLTDADSKRILASMRPLLKRGDVGGALLFGINGVAEKVQAGKADIMVKPTAEPVDDGFNTILMFVLGIIGFVFATMFYFGRKEKKAKAAAAVVDAGIPEYMRYNKTYTPTVGRRARGTPTSSSTHLTPTSRQDDRYTEGLVTGAVVAEVLSSSSSSDSGFSSSSSSDYSSNSSDWSGGGSSDSFSGGGSSDSW